MTNNKIGDSVRVKVSINGEHGEYDGIVRRISMYRGHRILVDIQDVDRERTVWVTADEIRITTAQHAARAVAL